MVNEKLKYLFNMCTEWKLDPDPAMLAPPEKRTRLRKFAFSMVISFFTFIILFNNNFNSVYSGIDYSSAEEDFPLPQASSTRKSVRTSSNQG